MSLGLDSDTFMRHVCLPRHQFIVTSALRPQGYHGQLYEGGTRVITLVSSESHISVPGSTYSGLFHQVDWHPTILSIAGSELVEDLDGFNQWHAIRTGSTSPRSEVTICVCVCVCRSYVCVCVCRNY